MPYLFYSDTYRCAFLPLAKSASTSTKAWMCGLDEVLFRPSPDTEGERTLMISFEEFEARFSGYYLFTVVRNPFSRLVSCYLDKFVRRRFDGGRVKSSMIPTTVDRMNLEKFDLLEQWAIDHTGGDHQKGISFETFLEAIDPYWGPGVVERDRADSHWASQYESGHFDRIIYDRVCRLENLSNDIALVEQDLGIPVDKRFEQSINRLRDTREFNSDTYYGHMTAAELSILPSYMNIAEKNFYSRKTIDLVREKYARDLSYFGYDQLGYIASYQGLL